MLKAQGGLCAICREPEQRKHPNGRTWELGVDHDHHTGRIRGLLCAHCNTAIALLREDRALFEAAIKYLEKYMVQS
jgi:hypothetical protein